MRVKEFITESASPVLYHFTHIKPALDIVITGKFELSSSVGNKTETGYAPPGYPYFLSTTRTRVGDYHNYVGSSAVMFVLDGTWFNRHYIVKPMDYWNRAWLDSNGARTRESEDRVFSKESTIPSTAITAMHVLIKEHGEYNSPRTRTLIIEAKKHGIPVFLYTSEQAWRLLNTRQSVLPSQIKDKLSGQQPSGKTHLSRNDLEEWLELIYKKSSSELTSRAEKLRYNLIYNMSRYPDQDGNLGIEFSNARKPGSGPSRPAAVKLIAYMRDNKIPNTLALKNSILKKWEAIYEKEKEAKKDSQTQGVTESAKPLFNEGQP